MKKKKSVLFIFGTRPEAIKMAPLIINMKKMSNIFKPIVCITGQHKQMLNQVLQVFSIKPNYNLKVMQPNQTLSLLTSCLISATSKVLEKEKPDLVMVQGDTTTAFCGALASFYNNTPIAHIEAGLRTGDFKNPFPEELNRLLIDHFADYCFAPTLLNKKTLIKEGINKRKIYVTGNTGIDALFFTRDKNTKKNHNRWSHHWRKAAKHINNPTKKVILITAHRRETLGPKMIAIFRAIEKIATKYPDWIFIYPVHLNPKVQHAAALVLSKLKNIFLIKPLSYEPFVYLMNRASLILTDSGGVQEEAPSLNKPVIVMRNKTERQEAVKAGTVTLAGNTGTGLLSRVERLMLKNKKNIVLKKNPYGDGHAAQAILRIIKKKMQLTK